MMDKPPEPTPSGSNDAGAAETTVPAGSAAPAPPTPDGAAAAPAVVVNTPPMPMAAMNQTPLQGTTVESTPPAPNAAPHATPVPTPAGEGWPVRVRLFGRTDVGRIREHNEDNFLVADLTQKARGLMENIRQHTIGGCGTLLAVCDGMGGAAAGEVASKLAVDIIYEQMQTGGAPRHREDLARRLVRAVEVAGLRIFAEAKLDRNRRGMGTTATAAALMDDHLFLAQVGDSRAYILRGEKLELVTRDQSLVNQLIEAGQLTEEEAENFEHSNIILQALGTADSVQVDLTYVKVREGDTLLMCSDGLSGMVRAEEIRQALLANPEPIDVCKVLTDKANDAGGHDNITVIVAKFEGGPKPNEGELAKYQNYVFTTADTNEPYRSAAEAAATPQPPSGAPADGDAPRTSSAGINPRLGATQVGMNSQDLMKQMQQIEAARAQPPAAGAQPASTPPDASPPLVPAPASPTGNTEAELRAAGLPPNTGMSAWIWVAAIVALSLVGIGIYALLVGKIPH
jgi:protein phosphatase